MSQIIHQLRDLKSNQLISTNTSNYKNYQVSTENISVTFSDNIKKSTVYIGKQGPSWHSTYFRSTESPNIYLADQALHYAFNIDKKNYINLHPLKLSMESINVVTVNISQKNQTFKRLDKTSWKLNNQLTTTLNHQIINSKIQYINNILATDITENITLSMDHSVANIAIKKSNNDQIILDFYKKILITT